MTAYRAAVLLLSLALTLPAGCGGKPGEHGGEDGENTRTAAGTPAPEVAGRGGTPSSTTLGGGPGRGIVARAGCLACHMFGSDGSTGPGPDLTTVGARLDREELRRALVSPSPPMPSYGKMPKQDLDDLVEYLTTLR